MLMPQLRPIKLGSLGLRPSTSVPERSPGNSPVQPSWRIRAAIGSRPTPHSPLYAGPGIDTSDSMSFTEPRCTNNDFFNNVNHIVLLTLIKSSRGFSRLLESMQAPYLGLRDAQQYELAHLRREKGKVLVAHSCLTLCHPWAVALFIPFMGFSRQEY